MPQQPDPSDVSALASLADPTRRRLYDLVAGEGSPVTRDQAAEALDIERSLAAYHLDKLVDEGLLAVSFARPDDRPGGPGAGRPAKRYERSSVELRVEVPPRDYRLVAEILARAVEAAGSGMREAVSAEAHAVGEDVAEQHPSEAILEEVLERCGFEPFADGDGVLRLRNCPFHRLAETHTELVCAMNLAFMEGLVATGGWEQREARLDPAPGRCCVAFDEIDPSKKKNR